MAEVNAFSIDGTKYQFTATDQTYVDETGLAQLGLDWSCTPDEAAQALCEAGGGVLLIDGENLAGNGDADAWGTSGIYSDGHGCLLELLASPVVDSTAGTFGRAMLTAHGSRNTRGMRVKHPVYSSTTGMSFDGADWCVLVYGNGDTWSSDTGAYIHGVVGSSGDVHCTLPVGAIAPGVTSASVSTLGSVYVYAGNESYHVTKSSKLSLTPDPSGGAVFIDVDDPGVGSTYDGATLMLGSTFVLEFS